MHKWLKTEKKTSKNYKLAMMTPNQEQMNDDPNATMTPVMTPVVTPNQQ